MSRPRRPCLFLVLYALFQNTLYSAATTIHAHADEYKNKQILCDKAEDCNVFCQEPNSCQYARIECPINQKCNITCSGPAACQHITINATQSSLFSLNDCDSGNDYTCSGLSIYFPPNLNGKRRGILHVGNYFNSYSNEMEFYAINGWKDIDTSSYFGGFEAEKQVIQGIMHCSPQYNQQCIFALYNWQCSNQNDICNNYTSTINLISHKEEVASSNEYVEESTKSSNLVSDLLRITSSLDQIWYIIGTIVSFLCCFLCLLLCLIRRSYDVHREAAKGLKTANQELAAFKIIHEAAGFMAYANSPYAPSIPMSSQYGTPIPKSKHPSNATSLDINQLYDDDNDNNNNNNHQHTNIALYPPSHWLPDTPLNSIQTQGTHVTSAMQSESSVARMRMHHNPPSIVSVSNKNELGLHLQQIHKLTLQHVRVPSPSFKSVNTLRTLNTNVSNQTMNTFMIVDTPNDENEDEFIEYQHAPDHIYNNSLTTTQTTSLHTKQMPSGASSSMPLSVNSPSNSPSVPIGRKSLNVHQNKRKRSNLIAHIPQFDNNNKIIDPLPEAHSAEIQHHVFDGYLGRRRDTAETYTASSNPFASTAAGSSSSSFTTTCTDSSISTTDSSSGSSTDGTYEDEETADMNLISRIPHKHDGDDEVIVASQPTQNMILETTNNQHHHFSDKLHSKAHSL